MIGNSNGQRGTISGAGGLRSLIRRNLGERSGFRKGRSELVRQILDLLDTVEHFRICVFNGHGKSRELERIEMEP